jgi:hypothetical protein
MAIAWNGMQEIFAELFWVVTDIPNGSISLQIWHSTNNDRAQRHTTQDKIVRRQRF